MLTDQDINNLIQHAQKEQFEKDNLKKAEELFLKAAELGNGHAAHELGTLYIVGGKGIKIDFEKSRYWFEKSLASGFEATIATDPEWFRKFYDNNN